MDTGNPVSAKPLVIAIDGPAGAGKSTITRAVSRRMGILFLDTGAMYRAATFGLMRDGIDLDDEAAVAAYVCERAINFDAQFEVTLDGVGVEEHIRGPVITSEVYRVANNPACRHHLVALQQGIIGNHDAVVEGRDATTVICPDATLKIYLDASPEERARRRVTDWDSSKGVTPDLDEVTRAIRERDRRDTEREVGALLQADDAVPIQTDGMTPNEVVTRIIGLAIQRRPLFMERQLTDQLLVGRNRKPGYVRVAEGSINDPPAPWQLGLTNPSPDRLPASTTELSCNHGGRQCGVLCQGRAVIVLAGREAKPGELTAVPMLPQTWYVIEPGAWHAVVQTPGTICAWAEASGIKEQRCHMDGEQLAGLHGFLSVYLPEY
ncbi:MAG: (d)CMP kinase [Planctomycetota bacterium]|jgi:cytidylate kinase|nr:(d)CMP kinase [Planctomycetota bacterium]